MLKEVIKTFSLLFFLLLLNPSPLKGKEKLLDLKFPLKSRLTVFGRKVIGFEYRRINWLNPPKETLGEEKPASEIDLQQKLQLSIQGEVGERIKVQIDYDDTAPRPEQQKISLTYRGKEGEIIQEASFGDLRLELPETEFVAYNKNLFGGKIKGSYKGIEFMGIGSVSKGTSESKTFTGRTTFEKMEILDTDWLKRKYYRFYFDSSHLPLTSESVEVWIDDGVGSNNQLSTFMEVEGEGGESYEGWFDLKYPGEDFIVNYIEGWGEFKIPLQDNYVIAIAYKDKNGLRYPSSGYRLIKKGQDEAYSQYELKNRYSLGAQRIEREDFILRIEDLGGNDVTSQFPHEIDYDFGILEFLDPEPFPEAYPPLSLHRYTIYVEYHKGVDTYLLRPDIVRESERVWLDGKLLRRDIDYFIDYSSGFLTFLHPELIREDSVIKVDYEYMPFMGKEATIFGARTQLINLKNFSLGGTYLYQGIPGVDEIPFLDSAPEAKEVIELDSQFKFTPALGKVPSSFSLSAEIARSINDPNTFGKALIENFESTRSQEETSLYKGAWRRNIPDPKPGPGGSHLGNLYWEDEKVDGETINPDWKYEDKRILTLEYSFPSQDYWDGIIYSFSAIGRDFSNLRWLEIWLEGEGGGETVGIDIGVINEDADGDGILDTEDENEDGKLNPGEDTGINIGGRTLGKGNGLLDTEDLNGDGILNSSENFSTYSFEVNWSGWRKIIIPLEGGEGKLITPSGSTSSLSVTFEGAPWEEVREVVKHLRFWVKKIDSSGRLRIAEIALRGDRWEKSNIEVKVVSNLDDPDFNPFTNKNFRRWYEDVYGSWKENQREKRESAFYLYGVKEGEEGDLQQVFSEPQDLTDYKTLGVWVFGPSGSETSPGFILEIRLAQDEDNFFYLQREINWEGWKLIEAKLDTLSREGTPSLSRIQILELRLINTGWEDPTTGLYVNDIFLSQRRKKKGLAKRLSFNLEVGEFFSLLGEYKEKDNEFEVIGTIPTNQDLKLSQIQGTFSPLSFLPLTFSWGRKDTYTLSTRETDLSLREEGKTLEDNLEWNLKFDKKPFPLLSLRGKRSNIEYKSAGKKRDSQGLGFFLDYEVPKKSPLLPLSIFFFLETEEEKKDYLSQKKKKEEGRRWELNLPFNPFPGLTIDPSYREKKRWGKEGEGKRSLQELENSLSVRGEGTFFGLSPAFGFQGNYREYDFSQEDSESRNVGVKSRFSFSLPIRVGNYFKIPWLEKSSLYSSYEIQKDGIYEKTSSSFAPWEKWGLERKDENIKSFLDRENLTLRSVNKPLDFVDLTLGYNQTREGKITQGTGSLTHFLTWPDLELTLDLNQTPWFKDLSSPIFTTSSLTIGCRKKETLKEDISRTISFYPSLGWKGRIKRFPDLNLSYTYEIQREKEEFFQEEGISRSFSSSHRIRGDLYTFLPWGKDIPLLNRLVDFKDKVRILSELGWKREKETLKGREQKDTLDVDFSVGIDYRTRGNIWINLTLIASYHKDYLVLGEDYFSYGGRGQVEIRF